MRYSEKYNMMTMAIVATTTSSDSVNSPCEPLREWQVGPLWIVVTKQLRPEKILAVIMVGGEGRNSSGEPIPKRIYMLGLIYT